jgi:hypothetical protein
MLTTTTKTRSDTNRPVRTAIFLALVFALSLMTVSAQNTEIKKISSKTNLPAWQNYKGVGIGMPVDAVHAKLGAPKSEDDDDMFYVVSETETVQVLLDGEKKVRTVSVVYTPEHAAAPKFADVFDKNTLVEPRADGSIYKMVRYEDAGYWVSYNRMAGEKAMVIVTIQKL